MENIELKRKAFSSTVWKFLERIIAQGTSFIVSLIIARILSPEDYSVVSIVAIFFAFANVIISGGLNTALIQKKDADSDDYSTVLYSTLLVSVVIYFALFFGAPSIARLYDNESLVLIIRIMALTLPVNAIKSIWCAYISSSLQFKKFFFATLSGTLISGGVGIYMAFNGYGAWALVAQQMINAIVDTIILVVTTRIGIALRFSGQKFKQLFKYGWKIFLSSLIGTAYSEFSPIIIGLKYSKSDLSFYTKGREFPNLLSISTTQTFSAVLFPVLSKVQNDKEKLLDFTRKFIQVCSFVVFPAMIGFFAIADQFVLVVLTEKWLPSVFYIRVFCMCFMFDIVAIGNCEAIKASGKSGIYMVTEIIKKTLYFAVLIVFLFCTDSPELFVISSIVCTVVQVLINAIPNIKLIDYKIRYQLYDVLPNLLISLLMGVSVFCVGLLNIHHVVKLIIQIVTGILVYGFISYISKNKSLFYLLKIAKDFLKKNG